MTAQSHAQPAGGSRPSDVQMLAASIRVKADKRLGRPTPDVIVALANGEPVSEDVIAAFALQMNRP